MKFVFTRVAAAISLISLMLVGCSEESSFRMDTISGNVRVLAPISQKDGSYKLQVFELLAISDLRTMAGKFAEFIFAPKIVDSKLEGESVKAQFIRNANGEYIPKDSISQQLAVIYFHLQKFAQLDKELGIEKINTWPRSVGVAVNIEGGETDNAFYDGKSDSMLFLPYTGKDLAISLNGGILAHEHFHSIFHKLTGRIDTATHNRRKFLKKSGIQDDSPDIDSADRCKDQKKGLSDCRKLKIYQQVILRSLNEGMADYWAWLYTSDPDFLSRSVKLPENAAPRTLDSPDMDGIRFLPRMSSILYDIEARYDEGKNDQFDQEIVGLYYMFGTSYARFFKKFTEIYQHARDLEAAVARKEVAKKLLQTLPQFKESYEKVKWKNYYSNLDLAQIFASTILDLRLPECKFLVSEMNFLAYENSEYTCEQNEDQTVTISLVASVNPKVLEEIELAPNTESPNPPDPNANQNNDSSEVSPNQPISKIKFNNSILYKAAWL